MLYTLLTKKKACILEGWLNRIFATYHPDSIEFFKNKKDSFRNPVGYTISHEIEAIYDGLLAKANDDTFSLPLENIIKIRSVQDFTSAQAVGFVFLLRQSIVQELQSQLQDYSIIPELLELNFKIDQIALLAFNIYSECREKIYQLKVNEIKLTSWGELWERVHLKPQIEENPKNT